MKNQTCKRLTFALTAVSLLLVAAILVICLFCTGVFRPVDAARTEAGTAYPEYLSQEGYSLEQVVVLSRHNIRSPLSGADSALGSMTTHEWFDWSSNPSELSLRGGAAETMMGQYFRKWMESEGLIPENFIPDGDEVRFYANSKQRTIATAEYFSAGLLPVAGIDVEYHMEFDQMDPVFTPQLTYVSDAYAADARATIMDMFGDRIRALSDNYRLLSDVLDMKRTDAYRRGEIRDFDVNDTELVLELNKEPGMKGSLKTGCSAADALVLQYYEESDPVRAAFGRRLSMKDWRSISAIKDLYGDVLFTAPMVAVNVAHPLLQEIEKELNTDGRLFTFLCGHDSNVGSVLAALGAEDYSLENTPEEKTPIGCKLVFSRWRSGAGERKISVVLVYQTADQLRSLPLLDLENPPASFRLSFSGLTCDEDGLYDEDEFMERLGEAIADYDELIETYEELAA